MHEDYGRLMIKEEPGLEVSGKCLVPKVSGNSGCWGEPWGPDVGKTDQQ